MGLGDCIRCVKYLLFIFNLIFCLIGLAILAVGVWLYVDVGGLPVDVAAQKYLGIFFMVIGGVITLLGFLGCCGAIFENRFLLVLFFILLLLVFLCLLAVGVAAVFKKATVVEGLEKEIDEMFQRRNQTNENTEAFELSFRCCGGSKAERTYTDEGQAIPDSCRPSETTSYVGCPERFSTTIGQMGVKAIIGIFVTAVVALLGMVFSMLLCCAISDMA